MPEDIDDEFARRLREVTASVAGLDEDEALRVLDLRLRRAEANGLVRHRLSLARARGSLALAVGTGAEHDVVASLQTMVATIEESGPAGPIPDGDRDDPEFVANVAELLQCHHQNAISILQVIAKVSVAGNDPDLVSTLEGFLDQDLEAISDLEGR
jgi:hypothetical protein